MQQYGTNIHNVAQWGEFNKQVLQPSETDRSNAATNRLVDDMAKQLELQHNDLRCSAMGWKLWANEVLAKKTPHEREHCQNNLPLDITQFFTTVATNEQQLLNQSRRAGSIGLTLLENITADFKLVEESMASIKESLKRKFDFMDQQMEYFKGMLEREQRVVRAFQVSLNAEETIASATHASNVTNQADTDHS